MSEEPKGPPVLKRAGAFTGAAGQETEVGPEAAMAAGLRTGGSLETASPIRLCYLAAANQAAGRLTLAGESTRYTLHFKRGVLEHVESSAGEDDLSHFLRKKQLVTDGQLADADEARAGFGGDLFAALAGLRIIDPAKSFPVLQEYGLALAACALAMEKGFFSWEPGAAAPATAFPLTGRWSLVCDAIRRVDGLNLRRRLAGRMAEAPSRVGGRIQLGDLKLTAQEVRLAGLCDGSRALGEMVQAVGPEADALLRMALLLAETELLTFVAPRGAAAAAAPRGVAPVAGPAGGASPPPAPAAPAPPAEPAASPPARPAASAAPPAAESRPAAGPAKPAEVPKASPPQKPADPQRAVSPQKAAPPEKAVPPQKPAAPAVPKAGPAPVAPRTDLASLRAAKERLAQVDHFAALGVTAGATAAQVKAAYFSLAKAYHPDSAAPDDPPEAKQLRADLFARVSEAWGVLGEEGSRKKYAQDLASGAAAVDVAAIMEAESSFTRATVLVKTRQYPQALEELGKAIALNKDEPEFHVWRAWVQFLTAPDHKKQHAASASEIEANLKKLPRCMPAYLFLGQMAKLAGDTSLAEKHWKRGLQVDPQDPDLLRELKYLRK